MEFSMENSCAHMLPVTICIVMASVFVVHNAFPHSCSLHKVYIPTKVTLCCNIPLQQMTLEVSNKTMKPNNKFLCSKRKSQYDVETELRIF